MYDFKEYQAAFQDHQNDLAHFGILGMKWGVRNDKKTAAPRRPQNTNNVMSTKTTTRGNTTKITSRTGNQKASLTIKRNRGAKLVAKTENTKIKVLVANTANVSAGAMRVAAAFVPELAVLNGVATAATLVGTVATIKK